MTTVGKTVGDQSINNPYHVAPRVFRASKVREIGKSDRSVPEGVNDAASYLSFGSDKGRLLARHTCTVHRWVVAVASPSARSSDWTR